MDAHTSWEVETQLLRMKVVYPISQANHPLASQLLGRRIRGDTVIAEMPEDIAESFPQCPGFTEASKRSNLSALLEEDKAAQKRYHNTTDPSRQLPDYLKGTNAVASGSRDNVCMVDLYWTPYLMFTSSPICVRRRRRGRTALSLKRRELHRRQLPN